MNDREIIENLDLLLNLDLFEETEDQEFLEDLEDVGSISEQLEDKNDQDE